MIRIYTYLPIRSEQFPALLVGMRGGHTYMGSVQSGRKTKQLEKHTLFNFKHKFTENRVNNIRKA